MLGSKHAPGGDGEQASGDSLQQRRLAWRADRINGQCLMPCGGFQILCQPGIVNLKVGGYVSAEHDVLRSHRFESIDGSTDHDLIMAERSSEHIGRLTDVDYGIARGVEPGGLRNTRNGRRQLDKLFADGNRGGLGAIGDLQFGEEIGDMGLNGAGSDEEGIGDLAIRLTLDQLPENIGFARREASRIKNAGICYAISP